MSTTLAKNPTSMTLRPTPVARRSAVLSTQPRRAFSPSAVLSTTPVSRYVMPRLGVMRLGVYGTLRPVRPRSVQRGAVPAREVGAGVVSALEEVQHDVVRRRQRAYGLVRQDEVVQRALVIRRSGTDPRAVQLGRLR